MFQVWLVLGLGACPHHDWSVALAHFLRCCTRLESTTIDVSFAYRFIASVCFLAPMQPLQNLHLSPKIRSSPILRRVQGIGERRAAKSYDTFARSTQSLQCFIVRSLRLIQLQRRDALILCFANALIDCALPPCARIRRQSCSVTDPDSAKLSPLPLYEASSAAWSVVRSRVNELRRRDPHRQTH